MQEQLNISGAELAVLQVLWENNRPMKIQEICDRLQNENWKYNTVATFLLRLEGKGAVQSKKQNRANYYIPLIKEEVYQQQQTKRLIAKLYHGSAKNLAVSLFRSNDMTAEDIAEIKEMFHL